MNQFNVIYQHMAFYHAFNLDFYQTISINANIYRLCKSPKWEMNQSTYMHKYLTLMYLICLQQVQPNLRQVLTGVNGHDLESICFCEIILCFLISLNKNKWVILCRKSFAKFCVNRCMFNMKDNIYLTSEKYNSFLNEVKRAKTVRQK